MSRYLSPKLYFIKTNMISWWSEIRTERDTPVVKLNQKSDMCINQRIVEILISLKF